MLIAPKIETGTVVSLKITSGEEIVAKLDAFGSEEVKLSTPFTLAVTPQGIAFVPFLIGADENVKVSIKHPNIIALTPSREEVKSAYIQQTIGLVTAGAGSIPETLGFDSGSEGC